MTTKVNKIPLNRKNILILIGSRDLHPSRFALDPQLLKLLGEYHPCLEVILLIRNLETVLVLIVLDPQVSSLVHQELCDFRLVKERGNHEGSILLMVLDANLCTAGDKDFNTALVVF